MASDTRYGITLPVFSGLLAEETHGDCCLRVRLPDGRIALVDEIGGEDCAFAAMQCEDYGGNVFARREASEDMTGLRASTKLRPHILTRSVATDPIAWLDDLRREG